jgi:hypothetical protein
MSSTGHSEKVAVTLTLLPRHLTKVQHSCQPVRMGKESTYLFASAPEKVRN